MSTTTFAEQKISLAQTILALNDRNKIGKIQSYINELLDNTQEIEEEFDAKKLSFLEWNKQFDDNLPLDEFIPAYGMTLREFRLKIYHSEKEEGMSKADFLNEVNNWK